MQHKDDSSSAPETGSTTTIRLTDAVPEAAPQGSAGPDTEALAPSDRSADLYRDYAVVRKIGDGGMGIVYLARDRRLGRPVAIKRLKPAALASPTLRGRFLHEARAAGVLSHPGIVHVYTLGEDSEGPYIVMEYVAGSLPSESAPDVVPPPRTLEQFVRQRGTLSTPEATAVMLKICRAVEYAHSRGIIHRDLKPANILMDPYGDPKVGDFGLARLKTSEESHLTVPGEKLLSLGYGAPEQETDAADSDERADIYALGALFFFLLTGQNPRYFREEDLPIPVRGPLCRAMSRDREQRQSSVAEFAEEIGALAGHDHPEQPTVKRTWRCKWCDTVNPVSIRFCAECGWDGGEPCRECGADMFVGMPFCRQCGASARDYEQIERALATATRLFERRDYEALLTGSRLLPKLEPTGPNGRAMLERLGSLRAQAGKNLERRGQLPELIAMEMKLENYERAEAFIREFRSLSPEGSAGFAEELAAIPGGIVRRDLARVDRMFRNGEWESGRRLLVRLWSRGAAEDPVGQRLQRRYRSHRRRRFLRAAARVAAVLVVAYVLAVPPASRLADSLPWLHGFFRPALGLYAAFPSASRRYVDLWERDGDASVGADWFHEAPESISAPPELSRILDDLERQRNGAASRFEGAMAAWRGEYRDGLRSLQERYKEAGDFEMLQAVLAEAQRFDRDRDIPTPIYLEPEFFPDEEFDDALPQLQASFAERRAALVSARDASLEQARAEAVEALKSLRSELTKSDRVDAAALVDEEIRKLAPTPRHEEPRAAETR